MSEETQVAVSESEGPLAAPPDDQNPAMIDARKTFIITMVGSALFIGAIVIFIL